MRLLSRCAKQPKSFVRHFRPEVVAASCAPPSVRLTSSSPRTAASDRLLHTKLHPVAAAVVQRARYDS